MKKEIVFLVVLISVLAGCRTNRQAEYTVLGEYDPNFSWLNEKLNGKVKQIIEKFYWGVADGENVRKGSLITSKEIDSLRLGFGYINESNYDATGNLVSLKTYDENNKYVGGWEFFNGNNRPDSAQRIWHDKVIVYDKLKYNENGILTELSRYDASTDTLRFYSIKTISKNGDTVEYKNFDNKGNLSGKFLHLFDEKGLFMGNESYSPDGTQLGSNRITYNEKNIASEVAFFGKNKEPLREMIRSYEYDSKGNWIILKAKNNKGGMNFHERTITYY